MLRLALLFSCIVGCYFLVGVYVLSAKIPRVLFPQVVLKDNTSEQFKFSVVDTDKNELLVRQYGETNQPCVIFFPGQHGGALKYEQNIFTEFNKHGFTVFSLSYPGQDNAQGQVDDIASLVELIATAISQVSARCEPQQVIIYGRSLGATVASFSHVETTISGIILESVAPTLSGAINHQLKRRWYLAPLTLLPVKLLIPNDYSLFKPLTNSKHIPVSIFQGKDDAITPLSDLLLHWKKNEGVVLHQVKKGTHGNTYQLAMSDIINTAKSMLLKRND